MCSSYTSDIVQFSIVSVLLPSSVTNLFASVMCRCSDNTLCMCMPYSSDDRRKSGKLTANWMRTDNYSVTEATNSRMRLSSYIRGMVALGWCGGTVCKTQHALKENVRVVNVCVDPAVTGLSVMAT